MVLGVLYILVVSATDWSASTWSMKWLFSYSKPSIMSTLNKILMARSHPIDPKWLCEGTSQGKKKEHFSHIKPHVDGCKNWFESNIKFPPANINTKCLSHHRVSIASSSLVHVYLMLCGVLKAHPLFFSIDKSFSAISKWDCEQIQKRTKMIKLL